MTAQPTSIDLSKVMMDLKNGKKTTKYLEVKWRLLWFREVCPAGTIETRLLHLDVETEFSEDILEWSDQERKKVKVGTKTEKGYAVFQATGTKMERAVSFPDYLEKAETGAIGRALAALGYGTQFTNEMSEGRIVDSPVATTRQTAPSDDSPATAEQMQTIKELCRKLNRRDIKRPATDGAAKALIAELQAS